jgi:hypothetical protein
VLELTIFEKEDLDKPLKTSAVSLNPGSQDPPGFFFFLLSAATRCGLFGACVTLCRYWLAIRILGFIHFLPTDWISTIFPGQGKDFTCPPAFAVVANALVTL